MDLQIGRLDSTTTTHEPEFAYPGSAPSFGAVVHRAPSDAPSDSSRDATLSPSNPASSASYQPRPPHIALPTSSPSVPGATNNQPNFAAVFGIALGVLATVIAIGAIVFYLCHRRRSFGRTRKEGSRDSWIDLERRNTSDLDSLPSYDEVKAPEVGAFALYTKYVPRTLGRLSPVSQTVPPTFGLIKEHHLSSDLSTGPRTPTPPARNGARQTSSPGYLDDIALTVTPFDTKFNS